MIPFALFADPSEIWPEISFTPIPRCLCFGCSFSGRCGDGGFKNWKACSSICCFTTAVQLRQYIPNGAPRKQHKGRHVRGEILLQDLHSLDAAKVWAVGRYLEETQFKETLRQYLDNKHPRRAKLTWSHGGRINIPTLKVTATVSWTRMVTSHGRY